MNAIETAEWLEEFGGDMAEHSAEIIRHQEKVMRLALEALGTCGEELPSTRFKRQFFCTGKVESAIKTLEKALK